MRKRKAILAAALLAAFLSFTLVPSLPAGGQGYSAVELMQPAYGSDRGAGHDKEKGGNKGSPDKTEKKTEKKEEGQDRDKLEQGREKGGNEGKVRETFPNERR